ncbi:MAG: BCCT family transporter [Myxococcota bacterium]
MRPAFDRLAFGISGSVLVGFVAAAFLNAEWTASAIQQLSSACNRAFGAFWQVLVLATTGVAALIAASPAGARRLGGRSEPEMSTAKWVAVILCTLLAGGGVFWSAAEPLYHFTTPPPTYPTVEAHSLRAANAALSQSFLHWGFLAWSVVGTLGAVAILLLSEDGQVPFRPSSLLIPSLGRSFIETRWASLVDGLSIIATAAGTIGPMGFLGLQLACAFESLFGVPNAWPSQLSVLAALVSVSTLSALSGINRGIQWLSRFNVVLAIALAGCLLVFGPGAFITDRFIEAMGLYVRDLAHLATFRADPGWLGDWTVFYWGWFIGYGPLMSLFVARISRGRTVREVVIAVGVVAPLLTNFWFSVLGGTGLHLEMQTPGSVTSPLSEDGLPAALLAIVTQLPLASVLVPGFLILIFVFLATSADSISYSIAMIVSREETPPPLLRGFYCVSMGAVAGALMLMGEGSVRALQSFIVVTAVPVSILMATLVFTVPSLLFAKVRDAT